ncbi:MAG: DUF5652 family protein [Gammaproteobacteria bacterium]|nr:MAG: hypothetical protein EVA53_02475 [Gammaproteobacteria bacterium]
MIQLLIIITLLIWEIYWTYMACWLASKNGHKKFFFFFLIFSTLGIAEILYVRKYRNQGS